MWTDYNVVVIFNNQKSNTINMIEMFDYVFLP